MTEPATNDGPYFINRALVSGREAIAERDPQTKMDLMSDALLCYDCAAVVSPSDPDSACAMGELSESCARFYSYAKPPEGLLEYYADNAGFLWKQAIRFYETAASLYPHVIKKPVLAAREHLAQLMEYNHYFKGIDQLGREVLFTPREIFTYREETALAGFPLSQARVALSYREGKGVASSFKLAAQWAGQAAPHINELPEPDASALFNLIAEIELLQAHAGGGNVAAFPMHDCRTGMPEVLRVTFLCPRLPN